jgi:hypothetical protein
MSQCEAPRQWAKKQTALLMLWARLGDRGRIAGTAISAALAISSEQIVRSVNSVPANESLSLRLTSL